MDKNVGRSNTDIVLRVVCCILFIVWLIAEFTYDDAAIKNGIIHSMKFSVILPIIIYTTVVFVLSQINIKGRIVKIVYSFVLTAYCVYALILIIKVWSWMGIAIILQPFMIVNYGIAVIIAVLAIIRCWLPLKTKKPTKQQQIDDLQKQIDELKK